MNTNVTITDINISIGAWLNILGNFVVAQLIIATGLAIAGFSLWYIGGALIALI